MAIVAQMSNVAHADFKRFAGAVIIVNSFKTVIKKDTEINFPHRKHICKYKYRNAKKLNKDKVTFIRKEVHVNSPKGLKT